MPGAEAGQVALRAVDDAIDGSPPDRAVFFDVHTSIGLAGSPWPALARRTTLA
jgi:hypothetical protein